MASFESYRWLYNPPFIDVRLYGANMLSFHTIYTVDVFVIHFMTTCNLKFHHSTAMYVHVCVSRGRMCDAR